MRASSLRRLAVGLALFALAGVVACGSSENGASSAHGSTVPNAANAPSGAGGSSDSSAANAGGAGSAGTTAAKAGPPWTAPTQSGRLLVTIRPERGRPRIGALDPWLVQLTTRTGAPVQPRQLFFDGGMPQHRHGFETKPRVTDDLGSGLFRVDGVRFQMAGAWTIRVDVATDEGADFAIFAFEVGP